MLRCQLSTTVMTMTVKLTVLTDGSAMVPGKVVSLSVPLAGGSQDLTSVTLLSSQ